MLPIPGSSVARPARASAATDTEASRTALAARPVGEHAVHDRPVELVQIAQLLERVRDRGVGQLRAGHRLQRKGRVGLGAGASWQSSEGATL